MRVVLVWLVMMATLPARALAHGGGLNQCGCHFDRKTGECHCHRHSKNCGCDCAPESCHKPDEDRPAPKRRR